MSQEFRQRQIDASIDDCQLHRPERNHYFHGKLMAARDMVAEQRYQRALVTRNHRYVTGFGVVTGLGATIDRDGEGLEVTIGPGVAIDCCGRPIVVPNETDIRIPEDEVPTANAYALRIIYEECVTESVPVPGRETTDERDCAYNRVIESFTLDVTTVGGGGKPVPPVEFPDSNGDLDTTAIDEDMEAEIAAMREELQALREAGEIEAATDLQAEIDERTGKQPALEAVAEGAPSLRSIAKGWGGEGPGSMPVGCEDHDSHAVLLGTFPEPGGDTVELDTDPRPRVYTNDMLYSAIARHTADFGNPHEVTAEQVGALQSVNGVGNPGGDVDFRSDDITFSGVTDPDDRAVEFAVPELDAINGRIDTHLEDTKNPHDVTAVQTGAVESIRGVVTTNGNLEFTSDEIEFEHEGAENEDPVIAFDIPALPTLRSDVDDHLADTDNPHDVTATQTGAIASIDGVTNPGGDVSFTSEDIVFERTNGNDPGIAFEIPRLGELGEELADHLNDTDNPHEVEVGEGGGLDRINDVEHDDGDIEFVSLTDQAEFVTDQRRVEAHQVGLDITGIDELADRLAEVSRQVEHLAGALEDRDQYLVERSIRVMAKEYESAERRYDLRLGSTVSGHTVGFLTSELEEGEGIDPDRYVDFLAESISLQADFYDDLEEVGRVSSRQVQTSRDALHILDGHLQRREDGGLFPIAQAQIRVADLLGAYQDPPPIE